MTDRETRIANERARKMLRTKQADLETAFHTYDRIFPTLKKRADKEGSEADRDALFRVHGLIRAELRKAEAAVTEYEETHA